MKKVYFSRAIDLMDPQEVYDTYRAVASKFQAAGFELVNGAAVEELTPRREPREIVESALSLIRKSDFVVVDLSLRNHKYIGCICEIVYAHLAQKPVAAIVGTGGNNRRAWLRYHISHICASLEDAIDWMQVSSRQS